VLFVLGAMLAFDPIALAALPTWPRAVVKAFSWITLLGDSAIYLVPAGVALLVLAAIAPPGRRADTALRHLALRLAFLFAAVAGTGILVNIVKRMIGRARPFHVEAGGPFSFEPFGWASKWASFPSGHATTAAAAATVLVLLLGRGAIPWAAAGVVLVCASRIVVGAHFVSDVLAGALFGCLGTMWLAGFLAQRGLVFRASAEGPLALKGEAASKTLRAWLVRGRAA
jgi:undecaprenyl-diphosphatase